MLKDKFKKFKKTEKFKIWAVTSVISLVLVLLRWQPGIIRNISDYFFMTGLLHIVVGCTRYIHNVGLFKTFSWMAYKRRTRKTQGTDGAVIRPLSLAEYTERYIYADAYQKDVGWPWLHGAIFAVISMALAFIA